MLRSSQPSTFSKVVTFMCLLLVGVHGVTCPDNSPAARPLQDILGGRSLQVCDITCLERINYNLFCYSEVGFVYDIQWWVVTGTFTFGLVWAIVCYIRVMQHYHALGEKVVWYKPTTTQTVIILAMVAALSRLVFMADTYNGVTNDASFLGVNASTTLTTFTQCVMGGELLLVVLVWRNVVESVTKMTVAKNRASQGYKIAGTVMAVIFVVVVPLKIIGNEVNPAIGNFSSSLLGMIFVFLLIGGVWYALSIRRIILGGISDDVKRAAVQRIQSSVLTLLSNGIIQAATVLFVVVKLTTNPYYYLGLSTFMLRMCEFFQMYFCTCIVSYKARYAFAESSSAVDKISANTANKNKASNGTPQLNSSALVKDNQKANPLRRSSIAESNVSKQDSNFESVIMTIREDQPLTKTTLYAFKKPMPQAPRQHVGNSNNDEQFVSPRGVVV